MAVSSREVNAQPVKRFFIDIITRDIGLIPAILDLVDNSVDSARALRPDGSLAGLRVDVVARGDEFSIEDNCTGISVEKASTYVFRMGRPDEVASDDGSIGQFGVGLKRSVFKLGRAFIVHSSTTQESFTVDLDVEAWEAQEDWNFEMEVDRANGASGTTIIVNRLYAPVLAAFSEDGFEDDLRDELAARHQLALGSGLAISLNGRELTPPASDVASSDVIAPAVYTLTPTTLDGRELAVRIVAGVAPALMDQVDEDADPEEVTFPAAHAGWSVFANGRMLLANDKSRLTGWGTGSKQLPMFHNQFARFRGFVYIEANDSSAIPWNTMKTSVDADDPIWKQIVQSMVLAGRQVIAMLNALKAERQAGLSGVDAPLSDALYKATRMAAADPHIERALLSATIVESTVGDDGSFSMTMTSLRMDARFPEPSPAARESVKRIAYTVDQDDFDAVALALGTTKAATVGRNTFETYLRGLD